ncbi:MAG: protein translocase subunit SecD [Desulfobulbaceae bacterium]|nr:protein translocase subunit SecD [Desulfobulbaceae bacterium]
MNKTLKWKMALLLGMFLMAGVILAPSLYKGAPKWMTKYVAPEGLNLGLDLQGGMHLVMKVDLDKAIANNLDLATQNLKSELADKQITVVRTPSQDPARVIFTLPNTGALDTVKEVVKGDFAEDLNIEIKSETGSFPRIILSLTESKINYIKDNAVNQSLEIVRNRIDQFGVAEPVIIRQGADEIVVQLPGIKDRDRDRALKLIHQTAQLEFKLLYEQSEVDLNSLIEQTKQAGQWQDGNIQGEGRRQLNEALQNRLPANTEIYFEKRISRDTGVEIETITPLLIKSPIMMTGDMVKDSQPQIGGTFNEPYVSLNLTSPGGRIFAEVTTNNVNKRFAIILDDIVKSAPVIRDKILGGRAQISGNFTYEEASDLSIVLRVGALPAPLNIIQNMTVGASLGQDSITKGLMSGLLGTFLVLVFMVLYYRVSGVIANAALLFNVLLLFAGLATMNATLTLPGIAGIILTIGMAVDANVLIFERIREELETGKTVWHAISAGYDRAFRTILDANVTTLIAALVLLQFGSGPIKGFAITLAIGIVASLFTSIIVTRLIFDYITSKRTLTRLSI